MTIPTQVQELIEGSGNTFHSKVARWFKANDWSIAISPYYMDQTQQKARELDLVAEKVVELNSRFGWLGRVLVRLFVECKFLPGCSVFWFIDNDKAGVEAMLTADGKFRPHNSETKKHHYLAHDRVAKLFASSNAKGQEQEPFYKALNQSLNALVSLREQGPRTSIAQKARDIKVTLDFPVIVCNSFSQLYCADFAGERAPEPVQDNFQLEVQYAYADPGGTNHDELFLIDIVDYERLSQFAQSVEKDAYLTDVALS